MTFRTTDKMKMLLALAATLLAATLVFAQNPASSADANAPADANSPTDSSGTIDDAMPTFKPIFSKGAEEESSGRSELMEMINRLDAMTGPSGDELESDDNPKEYKSIFSKPDSGPQPAPDANDTSENERDNGTAVESVEDPNDEASGDGEESKSDRDPVGDPVPESTPQPEDDDKPESPVEKLKDLPADQVADPIRLADALYNGGYYQAAAVFYQSVLLHEDESSGHPRDWVLFQFANCLRDSDPARARGLYKRLATEHPDSRWKAAASAQEKLLTWKMMDRPREILDEVAARASARAKSTETKESSGR